MKFQKVNAAFSFALCACLLAGCSIPPAPASSTSSQSVLPDSVSSENGNQGAEGVISSVAPSSESVAGAATSDSSHDLS